MVKLFVIFSLVFCVSGWGQDFRPVGGTEEKDVVTIRAREVALNWIRKFSEENQGDLANTSRLIISNSNQITIGIEKSNLNSTSTFCNNPGRWDRWAMFDVVKSGPTMFLCNTLFKDFENNFNAIVQIIVHEYYHFWEHLAGLFTKAEKQKNPNYDDYAVDYEIKVSSHYLKCIPYIHSRTEELASKYQYKNYRSCD